MQTIVEGRQANGFFGSTLRIWDRKSPKSPACNRSRMPRQKGGRNGRLELGYRLSAELRAVVLDERIVKCKVPYLIRFGYNKKSRAAQGWVGMMMM